MIQEVINGLSSVNSASKIDIGRVIRNRVIAMEKMITKIPGSTQGDSSLCPLKHTFVDGAYVREIFMPKGMLIVSKIHKVTHPYFILKGDVSVLTEDGVVRLKGPYSGVTKAGTKRALYIHEDTVWITVHVTKHKDLKKIEKQIIAKNFKEIGIKSDDKEISEFIDKFSNPKLLKEVNI